MTSSAGAGSVERTRIRDVAEARFRQCPTYIELVSEAPASELRDLAASLGPDAEEAYVTTAQMLRTEERAEALVEVLTARFGPLPESVLKTVRAASLDQMRAWTTRAVTAGTLDEVFG
jgi:hypothetical protein